MSDSTFSTVWAARAPWSARLGRRLASWESGLAVLTVVLVLVAVATTPGFADDYNLQSSMSRMAAKALLVLPLVPLIIAREIDISVASTAALSGITLAMATEAGASSPVAVLAALATGLACGAVNAFFVLLGLPSLIVTLGTLAVFRGLCYVLVGGTPVSTLPPWLLERSFTTIEGTYVPFNVVPFVVLAVVVWVVLHATPFGRQVFAIGGNPGTARYAGVPQRRVLATLFLCSGLVAAVAGIVHTGLNSSASPDAMLGFELDAVTVVFLGGVSFLGGVGRMSGVLWALATVVAVRSMLQLQNVGAYGQSAVIGLLLIGSLLAANATTSLRGRLRTRRQARLLTRPSTPPSPAAYPREERVR